MALLAYVASPNVVWGPAYDLMNIEPNDTDGRTMEAFLAEEPRVGLPFLRRLMARNPGLRYFQVAGVGERRKRTPLHPGKRRAMRHKSRFWRDDPVNLEPLGRRPAVRCPP